MRLLLALCAICVSSTVACSAAEDAATDSLDSVHSSYTLSGKWHETDGTEGPATATFEQRGVSASVTVELTGHQCVSHVVVGARVDFDGVKGEADVESMHLTFSGDPDLKEVLGNFESLQQGPCPGQRGNIHLFR